MTALADAPDLYEVPEEEEHRKAFRVDGLGTATWAMEHARDLALRQREIERVAEARMERLRAWCAEEVGKLQRDRSFFEGALMEYALRLRQEDPKRKSLSTPFGKVTTRETEGKWEVDETAALDWARANRPELVATREAFALGEAKKVLVITESGVIDPVSGTLVEGITTGPARMTSKVTVDMSGDL